MSHAENLSASKSPAGPTIEVTRTDSTHIAETIEECEQALSMLLRYCRSESFTGYDPYVGDWAEQPDSGYQFYEKRFFLADGRPGYYHERLYPHDVHSAAQGVITFVELIDLMPNAKSMANRVVRWATKELQDSTGFFYFQKQRFYTIKTPYIRWAQAWMLYALSLYLSRKWINENV